MKLSKRKQWIVLGSIGLAAAAGVGAVAVPKQAAELKAPDDSALAMLRERSPGMRLAGAETNKHAAVPVTAITPASYPRPAVLSERESAPPATAIAPAGIIAPAPAAPIAAVAAPAPVPAAAIVPAVAIPAVAAAAASGPGLAALLPVIPAAFAIGGGGGGGITTTAVTPAVPEPQTWMMMITGFGLLGMALRRQRRRQRVQGRAVPQTA